jgi:CRP-like cAMP-binding protein
METFFLADTYLLRGAAMGDVEAIQTFSEVKEFAGGDSIVTHDDRGQDLMVMMKGRAKVETRDGDLIDQLRIGDMVGEVAFLDGKGRTATVTALGECKVLVIPADRLREHMKRNPALEVIILRNAALALCGRLRESNLQVESMLTPR